ncbi:hypothetical protein Dda_1050 [Drechslerella dactyloides]|uniref:Uncharacterized protein n=1 Tax=Drechslerella dactyloides TaxID=74499 RepID=A0AAD6J8H5_DREDA|nr:hypothetical protein Dda_1050 [Drechslerella dactyloides]
MVEYTSYYTTTVDTASQAVHACHNFLHKYPPPVFLLGLLATAFLAILTIAIYDTLSSLPASLPKRRPPALTCTPNSKTIPEICDSPPEKSSSSKKKKKKHISSEWSSHADKSGCTVGRTAVRPNPRPSAQDTGSSVESASAKASYFRSACLV